MKCGGNKVFEKLSLNSIMWEENIDRAIYQQLQIFSFRKHNDVTDVYYILISSLFRNFSICWLILSLKFKKNRCSVDSARVVDCIVGFSPSCILFLSPATLH